MWGRPEDDAGGDGAGYWGSLFPAVWSFMLALRERGLGSAWTTIHLIGDGEQRVAELLGIPFDKVARERCSRSPTRSAPTSSRPSASRSPTSSTGTAGTRSGP